MPRIVPSLSGPGRIASGAGARRRHWQLRAALTGLACGLLPILAALWVGLATRQAFGPLPTFGIGSAIVLLGLGIGVWLSISVRSEGAAVWTVTSALDAFARGRRDPDELRLDPDLGPVAEAWNGMVGEIADSDGVQADAEHGTEPAGDLPWYRSACDAMASGILIIGSEGNVRYLNGAAALLLRARREEAQDVPYERVLLDPEVRTAVSEGIGAPGASYRRNAETESDSDPNAGALRFSIRKLGESLGLLVHIEDITPIRAAERARLSFVADATHELRTPLTTIKLYVEEAIDAEGDHETRARALNVINSEAGRLERIVSDMLSVSEIESGALSLQVSDIRLDALFEEITHDFAASARDRSIEFSVDLPPKLPVISGDRGKVSMALHNLIGNAIKYTPEGGKVVVRVGDQEGRLTVDVEDTGFGIAPDEQERVFEKFYRASDERAREKTGSGIGLALAREVVRLHGGEITLESEIDRGSRFTLTLPARADAA